MPVRLFNSIFFLFFIFLFSLLYEAQTGEFVLEAEELLKLRETLTRVYVQRTGKPLWVVSEDMERDVFMSATEALFGAVLSVEEHVLGCMCDSFRS